MVNRCSLCKESEESVDLLYNDKVVMDVLRSKLWDEMGVSRDYEKFAPQMEGMLREWIRRDTMFGEWLSYVCSSVCGKMLLLNL